MKEYYPGQSVRFSATLSALGVMYTPANVALTLQQAAGWGTMSISLASSIIVDAVGMVHADTVLPNPLPFGPWVAIMQTAGPAVSDAGTAQEMILIRAVGS